MDDLYLEFVKNIGNHSATDIYDEDELLDIYDAASDNDDAVTKLEVLLYGARYYPDNAELLSRRAFFYDWMNEKEVAGLINSSIKEPSFLDRLLQLKLEGLPPDKAQRRILRLVEPMDDLTDEETIQLINVANDLGLYQWLKKNYPKLLAHCSYKQTMLYELGNVAEEQHDYEFSVKMFDELTGIDAFNVNFWQRLVMAYGQNRQFAEAENAAENALAVKPDDALSQRLLARAKGMDETFDPVEVLKLYQPSIDAADLEQPDMMVVMAAYMKLNDTAKAYEALEKMWKKGVRFRPMLTLMAVLDPKRGAKVVKEYIVEQDYEITDILHWLNELVNAPADMYDVAIIVLEEYIGVGKDILSIADVAADIYYQTGRYQNVIDLYTQVVSEDEDGKNVPMVCKPQLVLPLVMSMARLGATGQAVKMARMSVRTINYMMRNIPPLRMSRVAGSVSPTSLITLRGYTRALNAIARGIAAGKEPDAYDPIPTRDPS